MDKRRMILIIAILVAVAVGAAWYLLKNNNNGKLVGSGSIEGTEIVVSSKATGKILEVKVDEGSAVSAGDIIALIDQSDVETSLKAAQARYKVAKNDLERSEDLYKDNMISSQQYDLASANFDAASAALDAAKLQLDNTTITAPSSGTILVRAVEPGELAAIGTPIVTMADLREVKLTVYLAEKEIGKIKLGQEVGVSVDSYPNEKFTGKITYISDTAEFTPKSIQTKDERTTQVFAIKIKIPNLDQKLKPGMPADAEF